MGQWKGLGAVETMGSPLICKDRFQLVQVFTLLLCSCAVQPTPTDSTPGARSTGKPGEKGQSDEPEQEDIKLKQVMVP